MHLEPLTAISSVDGRYRATAEALAEYFSEYALIRMRLIAECQYLIALSDTKGIGMRPLTPAEKTMLRALPDITVEDAQIVKQIERDGYGGIPATNHDVKAIEYFIKLRLKDSSLADVLEWVHFALTSEDVNSVAHALALRGALEAVMLPALKRVHDEIVGLARAHADTAMLARTHGQSATPTTFGKEMNVFAKRLEKQITPLRNSSVLVKWGGPSGNYNAQMVALPQVDWLAFAHSFAERLNAQGAGNTHFVRLELNEVTTQIEPHDTYAEMFDNLRRINTVLLDLSQDMWRYISDGWVTQKPKDGEIGSSAMPHKVNPIDFENAEGNFGIANALFEHLSRKLPVSRLQRDLSDSTVARTFGTAFAHSLIGYHALARGFSKIGVNEQALGDALMAHPEVLAEAIQTVLRVADVEMPYEKLKALTRGKQVTLEDLAAFIDGLDISPDTKAQLRALRPGNYTGLAGLLARK
ncbi:adenylosuccinate lyase [Bradyrhizobium sp. WSM 1704]|uniref:adenylosuccinate lyase n=1 Tax=Bradyrhizobium semiaridum TaxID=2821404 RepID=UPI001CE28943|nr:adenylosuccinate lyase [Bradyrhizobium semiaridum]MCA6124839.1 adenylosuccinate lyase [Bradyrhizobium semiaridum]